MAGKFKFSFTKKNTAPYHRPASPVYRPSEVDYKICNEARKSYGVTTDEDCKQNLEQREKNTLLNEVFIPLNNSYTKSACFGMDVYNNFRPCLKIIKQGFNCAIQFTLPQFKTFLDVLDDIINALRYKDSGSYELEDYVYLNSAHLKMAGKFKFNFAKKNATPYHRPESPVYRPSEVDYKLCNEARKSYGVTTDEDCKQNLEQREKNTLLNEIFIPLNNSYTKSACFGMDVYNNFRPCLKIIKQGFNCAIQFTLPQFKTFLEVLDDIINALRYKDSGSYELEDYIVLTTDLNAVRFAPKKSDEKYQLYLGLSSLQSIRKMKNYFISRMKKLEKCDFQFNQFIENVVDVIDKKKNIGYEEVVDMNEIGYEEFHKVLDEKHKDNNMLQDLVHKFPHYVTVQVKNYMESYDDRFLYK
ncbi:hypothetical protein FQR65_LT17294 [Abscondita terminalis]|nr:hypothetical protein FQR65_LT17294 [Abscondita terminalis]